jgi:alkylated DNA repair dioxygenase AlkB
VVAHVRLAGFAQQIPVRLSTLSAVCPCDLLLDFLPKQLAHQLLSEMLQESACWVRGAWWFAGLQQAAPRTSMHYQLSQVAAAAPAVAPAAEAREAATPAAEMDDGPTVGRTVPLAAAEPSSSVIAALPQCPAPQQLSTAAGLVAAAVSSRLAAPAHQHWQTQLQQLNGNRAALDVSSTNRISPVAGDATAMHSAVVSSWAPTYALANLYSHGQESVGSHSDRLTALGPLPTIASLSLGTTRTFRLHPADAAVATAAAAAAAAVGCSASSSAGNGGGAPRVTSVDIPLPHNSLLIMWPPTQEEWLHEVRHCATCQLFLWGGWCQKHLQRLRQCYEVDH